MEVEFRSHKDDAWYNAYLILENGDPRLRIKFSTFPHDRDEVVKANDLKSLQAINAFKYRVRKLSIQLQDTDAPKSTVVSQSTPPATFKLSATAATSMPSSTMLSVRSTSLLGRRTRRAVVGLSWGGKAAQMSGNLRVSVLRIFVGDDEEISPVLTSFLNAVQESMGSNFSNSTTNSNSGVVCDSGTSKLAKAKRFKTSSANKVITPAQSYVASWASNVRIVNPSKRDVHEMDGGGVPHVLILGNVEKGISSVTIMQFLYQQVSITCKAFVMPWKPSETYTRAIILDNEKNIAKLSKFLESPDHIVISSKGRPWAGQKKLLDDTLKGSIEKSQAIPRTALRSRTLTINELKIVSSGSHECKKAERLKNLFRKFADHQRRLHKRLLHEEEKIVQRPMRQIEEMDV